MSTSTLSPNMNLIIPTVGQEASPTWSYDINASLTLVDQHDHTAGNGVQLTPASLNINSALTLNNNFLTNVAGVSLYAQLSTPANGTLYRSGGDLYYNNGSGLNIQITNSSGVAGSPGTISGLTSPASASYSAPTFTWQSNTGIAANMDFASAILRNISPNSTYTLTLSPPAALSSNYTITLPSLPASNAVMQMSSAGVITPTLLGSGWLYSADLNANAGILGSQIASRTILAGNIATGTITENEIANATISGNQIGSGINLAGITTEVAGKMIAVSNSATTAGFGLIRCTVSSGGAITGGEGFTLTSASGGVLTLAIVSPMADGPAAFIMPRTTANAGYLYVDSTSTTQVVIKGFQGSDYSCYVFAIGIRAS